MKLALTALADSVLTTALFGGSLQPIALATLWPGRLGLEHWRMLAALGVAASTLVVSRPVRDAIPDALRPSVFVILAIHLPNTLVGLDADRVRHRAVLAFDADEVEERSSFASVSEAPTDFQFFLHTAALKNGKPYAWS
ncbi:hypothetical protein LRS73_14625 [Methylobacterium currus]|nr:hypothetical protein [Methylobacterium currus]UHC13828.1 hypothetical protein LRS73_14625 [Methylobacterium currus]